MKEQDWGLDPSVGYGEGCLDNDFTGYGEGCLDNDFTGG